MKERPSKYAPPNTSGVYLVGLPGYANQHECPSSSNNCSCSDQYPASIPASLLRSSHWALYDYHAHVYDLPTSGTLLRFAIRVGVAGQHIDLGRRFLFGNHLGSTTLSVFPAALYEQSREQYLPWGTSRYSGNSKIVISFRFTGQRAKEGRGDLRDSFHLPGHCHCMSGRALVGQAFGVAFSAPAYLPKGASTRHRTMESSDSLTGRS